MKHGLARKLRAARDRLIVLAERNLPEPGPAYAARICELFHDAGLRTTTAYFQCGENPPDAIVDAYLKLSRLLRTQAGTSYLSLKAPPLAHDSEAIGRIARASNEAGLSIMLDALAHEDADMTMAVAARLRADYPATGCVLPARWARSSADAAGLRDTAARIRIVKGEWPEPGGCESDIEAAYLDLVARLAGRAAPVAVATHKPELAHEALSLLRDAGTPCELEQVRGLPRRRTMAVARGLAVPVRIYVPFGPGWWTYALSSALARPYLPAWYAKDMMSRPAVGRQTQIPTISNG